LVPSLEESATLRLIGDLIDGTHLAIPDRLGSVFASAAERAGWEIVVLLIDYEQRELRPLPGDAQGVGSQSVDGTLAGRCFRQVEAVDIGHSDGYMWVPLIDGVERLGVLRLRLPGGAGLQDVAASRHVRWVAQLIAHLIASKTPYADYFHIARLTQQRSVPSELIWSALPPLTVACEGLVIAGGLEPTHAVAGDIFDYAIDDDVAHIAIADATGHDLRAALVGAMILATFRAGRRRLLEIDATVAEIDNVLLAYEAYTYATGVFGQLDLTNGAFRYVNAGHPAPLLLRDGKVVKPLDAGRRILLGWPDHRATIGVEHLEPGDWLVFHTDGVTEARDEHHTFFGLERLIDVVERCAAHHQNAAETLRGVMHAVLAHQSQVLQDDATVVVVQWMTARESELEAT
jgi:serine phosphatase RsbU (regulator of sigma subunit)